MNTYLRAFALTGLVIMARAQEGRAVVSADYPYIPAFVSTVSAAPGHTEVVAFPLRGAPSKVPVRTASSPFAYSPAGDAIYGQCSPDSDAGARVALCRIELKSGLRSTLPGSIGLYAGDIAVSTHEDCILVSGVLRGESDTRGVFKLSLPSGKMRIVLVEKEGSPNSAWTHLSLAPDCERALGSHDGLVEVIDLAQNRTKPLDGGLFLAAWSPDGKWVAAVENGEKGRTILMDAGTLQRKRTLGPSEIGWSPDSRYLLGFKPCDSYHGTLEVIDVGSGYRIAVESSRCQLNQATVGWVRRDAIER
jgi:hypothetical protein